MSLRTVEGLKVGKFGGTSMATPDRMLNVKSIITADPSRRVVTVSAPGAKDGDPGNDFRVTQSLRVGQFNRVFDRFGQMAHTLFQTGEQHRRVAGEIDESRRRAIGTGVSPYAESRGEYLSGLLLAEDLGATFVDPTKIIKLSNDGSIHPDTYQLIPQFLPEGGLYVVPGYFGANVNTGDVQLLPPGGTDLTGSILARGLRAKLYENWTDIDGVRAADPRIVDEPVRIPFLTFAEMGELSHRGFNVLQPDAVAPVAGVGIPINLRSSLEPELPGTMVVSHRTSPTQERAIGIASNSGYVAVEVAQPGMGGRPGALATVTEIFAASDIPLEQGPGGREHVSFIAPSEKLTDGEDQEIMSRIRLALPGSDVSLSQKPFSLVAVVGQTIADDATHLNADMYPALSAAHIRVGAHIQSLRPNSVVLSVGERDEARTVNVLYDALIR